MDINTTLSPYQQCLQLIKEKPRLKDRFFILQTIENDYAVILDELKANAGNRASVQPPPIGSAVASDKKHLYFIHNTRHFSLLKERLKYQVFIDKLLIIISHEFLLSKQRVIKIHISKLCLYFHLVDRKENKDNIRKNIKRVTSLLIQRDFISSLSIKNSLVTIELNDTYYQELIREAIKTRVSIKLFDIKGDEENIYKIARVVSFYRENIKKEINKESLLQYVKDSNNSRTRANLEATISKLSIIL